MLSIGGTITGVPEKLSIPAQKKTLEAFNKEIFIAGNRFNALEKRDECFIYDKGCQLRTFETEKPFLP